MAGGDTVFLHSPRGTEMTKITALTLTRDFERARGSQAESYVVLGNTACQTSPWAEDLEIDASACAFPLRFNTLGLVPVRDVHVLGQ